MLTWSPFRYVGSKNLLLNYVLTWSPFGYVGSLVSFTEFSHIFKKNSPFELRVDLIPFWVRRQLGIIYWVQSHLQKKKKNPLLNYVLTWSPFGYIGNLVSFTEFSHIFQKKKSPSELRVDLIPFRVRRQLDIIYWVQSHLQKNNSCWTTCWLDPLSGM